MRAGRLDRIIDIQRNAPTQSSSGEPQDVWTTIISRRRAGVRAVSGDERSTNVQTVGREQIEFHIRWSDNVSDLSQKDRIIYPALSEDSPEDEPSTKQIHDILEIHEVGRREGLHIVALRRSDVTL